MSAEICYVPDDTGDEINHRLIESGEGFYINDYSSGVKEIIAAECLSDDTIKVMVMPDEGPLASGHSGYLDSDELPQPHAIIYVDEKRPYEHQIVDESSVIAGLLRIRYADSRKLTPSGLIPQRLRHHN
jgi:hypothetical protein